VTEILQIIKAGFLNIWVNNLKASEMQRNPVLIFTIKIRVVNAAVFCKARAEI